MKVNEGDPLDNSPLDSARFVNDLVDVSTAFREGRISRPQSPNTHGDDNNIIMVRNDTGADLSLGEAVKIGDYLLGEKYPNRRWFEALEIDTTFSRRIAVAAEPIPEDKIGRAYIAGMCPIKYTGTAPSPGDSMGPKPGTALLTTGYPGFARVEAVTDSGTPKLALATLGEIGTLLCKASAGLSPGPYTGSYTIQSGDPSSNANAGFTSLPTIHIGMSIDSGKLFVAHWLNNCWVALPFECNDE